MAIAAATLIVTYATATGTNVILTRRTMTLRRHPGQIAFPGGIVEVTDRSALDAALREAREEIGLRIRGRIDPIALTPVETLTSAIVIQPYLIQLEGSPTLRADPNEVAEILRIPIEALQAFGARRSIPHPRRPGEQTTAYWWNSALIWGATAISMDEILRLYCSPDNHFAPR